MIIRSLANMVLVAAHVLFGGVLLQQAATATAASMWSWRRRGGSWCRRERGACTGAGSVPIPATALSAAATLSGRRV